MSVAENRSPDHPDGGDVSESPDQTRTRVRNRRKRYLDTHPSYFEGDNLELADPLLYDRLIRRFLTAHERELQGRERGYTGRMEADILRSEAKLEALQRPDPNSPIVYKRAEDGSIMGLEAEAEDRAQSREEGVARWREVMGQRFLRGGDGEFDYRTVDQSDEFDDREEEDRRHLEDYVGGQQAEFVGEDGPKGETGVQDF